VIPNGTCPSTRQGISCLQSRDPTASGVGLECCYYRENGALVPASDPGAGTVQKVHSDAGNGVTTFDEFTHFAVDIAPYDQCCVFSSYCPIYKDRRESTTCSGYALPYIASGRIDNYMSTFDSLTYKTFDSSDRLLLRVNDTSKFVLQVRSKSTYNFQTYQNDLAFVGLAAATATSSNIVLLVQPTGEIRVSADGKEYTFDNGASLDFNQVSVSLDCSTEKVTVVFDIGVQLVASSVGGSLAFQVMIPESLRGKTVGLLGTFDGKTSNDFTIPDGTFISTATEPNIVFYTFESQWRVFPADSLFSNSVIASSSYEPPFEAPSLSQCTVDEQVQITTICSGAQSCIDAAASTCSLDIARAAAAQLAAAQGDTAARNMPPVIAAPTASLSISLAQNGRSQVWTRTFTATDPQNAAMMWAINTALSGVNFVVLSPTSIQVTVTITSQMTTPAASILVTVTNSLGASASTAISLACTCGCPFGGFEPSIRIAPLGTAIPVTVPVCVTATDSMVCRFSNSLFNFDQPAVYAMQGTSGVARCNTPEMAIGGDFMLTFSSDGGTTFPYNGGAFSFSPTTVSLLIGVVGTDGVTYPTVTVPEALLCDVAICASDPYRPSDFLAPFDHGMCVKVGNTPVCATSMSALTTVITAAEIESADAWTALQPRITSQIEGLLNAGLNTQSRRRAANAPADVKVVLLNYDIVPDGSVRVFYFPIANGASIPASAVDGAMAKSCLGNQDPKLEQLCGPIIPPAASTGTPAPTAVAAASAGSNLAYLALLVLVVVVVVIVIVVVRKQRANASPRRASATDSEVGRAVSFANPMYAASPVASATPAAPAKPAPTNDDMYIDDNDISNFEPAANTTKPVPSTNTYDEFTPRTEAPATRPSISFDRGVTSVTTDDDITPDAYLDGAELSATNPMYVNNDLNDSEPATGYLAVGQDLE